MMGYMLLLFVLLPLADMLLLVQVAAVIGIMETVLLVVLTGIIGVSLIRKEGFSVLTRLQHAVFVEEVGQTMIEGALIVAGGVFLLSPGIITDLLGFALVTGWTRQRLATRIRTYLDQNANFTVEVQAF